MNPHDHQQAQPLPRSQLFIDTVRPGSEIKQAASDSEENGMEVDSYNRPTPASTHSEKMP